LKMETPAKTKLRIGDWCVDRSSGQISRNGKSVRLEERSMRLLLCLAEHAGAVVSVEELLNQVWPEVTVTQDSVYQAVTSLRRQLGDDAKQPAYIATVPRLGYRMVAEVGPWTDRAGDELSSLQDAEPRIASSARAAANTAAPDISNSPAPRRRAGVTRAAVAVLGLGIVAAIVAVALHVTLHSGKGANGSHSQPIASPPPESLAVLPFLDLTEGMQEETFADGMTEELIDRLSKIPGLRVTPPTSSFLYKEKQVPVAEIARALNVAYVLDGSVRKSGGRIRVAARLIRADNGYVVWSDAYDRPFDDILMVQDDIAGEATKALKASIEASPDRDKLP
jgi:transcriptional activator of cad operon